MNKPDLALNLQWLICHKTKLNPTILPLAEFEFDVLCLKIDFVLNPAL